MRMVKEAVKVLDREKFIIVIDSERQMWKFKKSKGVAVVPNIKGGFTKCKLKKRSL